MTGRILAIGDIHGCNQKLQALLSRVGPDPQTDTLVFIGDYLDRGPDVRDVLDTLIDLGETFPGLICLKGNHEEMFLNYYARGLDEELYMSNGGWSTLSSYGLTLADARAGTGFPESHLAFLSSLPLYHETEDYIFVHAGLRPGIPFSEQSEEDMLWIRHEFIDSDYPFEKTIVFGHTPLREPLIEKKQDRHRHGGRLRPPPDLHRAPLPED